MEEKKNILKFEECEIVEELNDQDFQVGFAVGALLVVGAAALVTLT